MSAKKRSYSLDLSMLNQGQMVGGPAQNGWLAGRQKQPKQIAQNH
jgi:hypothetical protein